jgi:hypothetical protein
MTTICLFLNFFTINNNILFLTGNKVLVQETKKIEFLDKGLFDNQYFLHQFIDHCLYVHLSNNSHLGSGGGNILFCRKYFLSNKFIIFFTTK